MARADAAHGAASAMGAVMEVIVSFTQVDTEGKPFSGQVVWKQAVRRMVTRVHAAVHATDTQYSIPYVLCVCV